MKVELACKGQLIQVKSIRFYIHPNSPLIIEIDIDVTSSLKWSDLKESWMRVEAKIKVDGVIFDKLTLQGNGWRPRIMDGVIRDCVQTLIAYSIDPELYTWLLNKPSSESTVSFLLYQRRLKEKAEDFFKRCLGDKLSNLPTGIDFEGCIAPAACIVREIDWNNCVFLTSLCQHLIHKNRKLEGWSTLGNRIWLISSASESSIDLSNGWNVTELGFTDRLLEGSSALDSEIVTGSSSGNFIGFIDAISNADQLTFKWENYDFPRLPTLISWEGQCYFCRDILFTFSFDDGDIFNWTSTCKLRKPNAFPSSTPIQHVNLSGEFHTWSEEDKYCIIKPMKSSNWMLVDSYKTDLIEDQKTNLLIKNYAPGHISNISGNRDGLFFNFKKNDKIDFNLLPGDIPSSFGLWQSKNDTSDSCTFTLIDGKNRLTGTGVKNLEINAEKDIIIKTYEGNINLENKSLEITASIVNIMPPAISNDESLRLQHVIDSESKNQLEKLSERVTIVNSFGELIKLSNSANQFYKKTTPDFRNSDEFQELKQNLLVKLHFQKITLLLKCSSPIEELRLQNQFINKFGSCPKELLSLFKQIESAPRNLLLFNIYKNKNDCLLYAQKIGSFLNKKSSNQTSSNLIKLPETQTTSFHYIYPLIGNYNKVDDGQSVWPIYSLEANTDTPFLLVPEPKKYISLQDMIEQHGINESYKISLSSLNKYQPTNYEPIRYVINMPNRRIHRNAKLELEVLKKNGFIKKYISRNSTKVDH